MNANADSNAIIIVEDDDSTARLMQHCLSRVGFNVEIITDGRAALELVERDTLPALIIIDYLMPYADGLKVTRTLRDHARWAVVPIICITGTTHDDTMIQGLRLHSDGFLTKPFRPEELVALVGRLTAAERDDAT
ncbi:MAG: response regulator [Gammaproteobacteria bacterium]